MISNESDDTPPWYERWFDREEYELVYRRRDEAEATRLVGLIEAVVSPEPGASILDVACGRGRHDRLLAHRGYQVTGIDLSERAVETARERAAAENLSISFLQADMREMSFHGQFDGAVNLFTSFGYFESNEEHERVISNIARALEPDGWFVQDFLNAAYVRDNLVSHDERRENGIKIEQERWIDDNRLNKEIILTNAGTTKTFRESVRLLTLDDFRAMYASADLEIFDIRGDYMGQPFDKDSPRLIMFARRT
jgi:SAM-dependent methyltransferase